MFFCFERFFSAKLRRERDEQRKVHLLGAMLSGVRYIFDALVGLG